MSSESMKSFVSIFVLKMGIGSKLKKKFKNISTIQEKTLNLSLFLKLCVRFRDFAQDISNQEKIK